MHRPLFPAKMSLRLSCPPERGLTTFAPLPVEQPCFRPFSLPWKALESHLRFEANSLGRPAKKLELANSSRPLTEVRRHFTTPLHRGLHHRLHRSPTANCYRSNEIRTRAQRARNAAKTGVRRERPHPWTHGASRVPWGRSRLVKLEA